MSLWQIIKGMMDPAATQIAHRFTLGDRGDQPAAEQTGPTRLSDAQVHSGAVITHIDNLLGAVPDGKKAVDKAGDLTDSLDENIKRLKALFRMPTNKDLVMRELTVATQPPTRAAAFFMEGLSDKMVINAHILQPLMLLSHLDHHVDDTGEAGKTEFSIDTVIKRLLPGHQAAEKYDLAAIAETLLGGDTVLLFDNERVAISVETKSPPVRSVGEPKVEKVIQGPHDAFVEAFRVNVALIRRRLKDPRVVTEVMTVGQVSHNYVAMMYVDGIANPKLVAEIKRRIDAINVDVVSSTGVLEQYIEDSPGSLMPGALTTERPDRAAAFLSEGHVVVLVDTSPMAMICPITFWSLMQTSEDYYLRYPFGSMLRYIRFFALILSVIVPAAYIAIVNYHPEMLPTELMLFIAATRENVPLPAVFELILMDLSFELIREAGTRIPSVIGPTMGLVASLVLGQAAVEARIVSPLMILVVALTGLASFAIPNYMTGFGLRTLRFLMLACAALLGFYGLATAMFILCIYLAGLRSFGVPYLSPVAPWRGMPTDVLNRRPVFEMETRPPTARPLDKRRQEEFVRDWDPAVRAVKQGKDGDEG